MTSNVKRHVQLPRSSQKGKKPTADDLKYGEIAVNFNNEDPFLAIKGSDDSIITMGFKDGKTGPWKKGEGEYSAVLDNGTPTSPNDKVNTATSEYATAEGKGTTASGRYSHAEGFMTKASGAKSHAEGSNNTASGDSSHAEGLATKANGISSHAEGCYTTAIGNHSHAEGYNTTAIGIHSHAEGRDTIARGFYSHVEGQLTNAIGNHSHAEGKETIAMGYLSHAEGLGSIALGTATHVEGLHIKAMNFTDDVTIGATEMFIVVTPEYSTDLEYYKNCIINGGGKSIDVLSAEFAPNAKFPDKQRIKLTLKEGTSKASIRATQITENQRDGFFYTWDFTFINKGALGDYSGHAEGKYTMVYSTGGHAEGITTISKGEASHAEGYRTMASGNYSHAEGNATTAQGVASHAEGNQTTASGSYSHASGYLTVAENESEFACGKYNKSNANQLFSIGIGNNNTNRKNAISVNINGVISGDVELTNGATSMTGLKISGGIESTNGMISPTYLNSSDERLKKDIETISENDINKVKHVDFKSYKFKSDDSRHYGIIAQDVEKAGLTELVTNGADGMKSVDYISLLILKIAELENELKSLKEQIKK